MRTSISGQRSQAHTPMEIPVPCKIHFTCAWDGGYPPPKNATKIVIIKISLWCKNVVHLYLSALCSLIRRLRLPQYVMSRSLRTTNVLPVTTTPLPMLDFSWHLPRSLVVQGTDKLGFFLYNLRFLKIPPLSYHSTIFGSPSTPVLLA